MMKCFIKINLIAFENDELVYIDKKVQNECIILSRTNIILTLVLTLVNNIWCNGMVSATRRFLLLILCVDVNNIEGASRRPFTMNYLPVTKGFLNTITSDLLKKLVKLGIK